MSKRITALVSISEAVDLLAGILRGTVKLSVEEARVSSALGRILAEDVYAGINIPPFNRSAVDGYAVRAVDVVNASVYNPVELLLKGSVAAGEYPPSTCIGHGEAIRVHTGSPVPCGADAVVMDEDVEVADSRILVYKPVSPGQNISRMGEDFTRGELVVAKGTLLKPVHIAALSSIGVDKVKVYRKLEVGVLASGDEVCEPGVDVECETGVYNSSARLLVALLLNTGFTSVKYYGVFPDDPEILGDALRKAAVENDLVVTTAGTGVSEGDTVIDVAMHSWRLVFRGVRMRPGRPTSLSLVEGKPVLHLSGYPVAAWTGYEAILMPAFSKWLGLKGVERPVVYARLSRRIPNTVGYTSYIRVTLRDTGGEYVAEPYMLRGSGVLSSLLRSHGYIVIPENVEGFEKDSIVPVYLF